MGPYVTDSTRPNLLGGAALSSVGGTSTGTAVEAQWWHDVTFELAVGTVAGTSPTLAVTIEGCESENFSSSSVISIAAFPGDQASTNGDVYHLRTHVPSKFVRAVVGVSGTNADFSNAELTPNLYHYNNVHRLETAAPLQ